MFRLHSTLAIAALATTSMASSPVLQLQSYQPISAPIKDAGIYHVATGTWTRAHSAGGLVGPSQLYDNTCTTGFTFPVPEGVTVIDSGRIPATYGQAGFGLHDCYEMEQFQIGYCTYEPLVTSIGVSYYNCYAYCYEPYLQPPSLSLQLMNVPGGGSLGSQGCWLVTVDLVNTTFSWTHMGDADGVYDNLPSLDHFGWSWTQLTPTTSSNAGPILAGDPLGTFNPSCAVANNHWYGEGAGTDHPGWGPVTGPGTGIGAAANDGFQLLGAGATYCNSFGGYFAGHPIDAFYHKIWGDVGVGCTDCGDVNLNGQFCFGSSGLCPGGVTGLEGNGCPNSNPNGYGAGLTGYGHSLLSADDFRLHVWGGAPEKPGLLIQGGVALNYPDGVNTLPDSAGLLCVSPQLRGQVAILDAFGRVHLSDFRGQPFGATAQSVGSPTYYQFWFRDPGNPNANPGPGAEFNFTNAVEREWGF